MGKPIAGFMQFPYSVNGIVVDGAKLHDGTILKNLTIVKQRSSGVYDLMSDGVVYSYIKITTQNTDYEPLSIHKANHF